MIKKYFDKILQNEVYKMLLEFKTNNFKSFLDEMGGQYSSKYSSPIFL